MVGEERSEGRVSLPTRSAKHPRCPNSQSSNSRSLLTTVLSSGRNDDGGELAGQSLLGPQTTGGVEERGELRDGATVTGWNDEDVTVPVAK